MFKSRVEIKVWIWNDLFPICFYLSSTHLIQKNSLMTVLWWMNMSSESLKDRQCHEGKDGLLFYAVNLMIYAANLDNVYKEIAQCTNHY